MDDVIRLIDEEIKRKQLTRAQFAKALGRSAPWLSEIMHQHIILTVPMLLEFAKILGIEASKLLPSEKDEPNPTALEEYVERIAQRVYEKKKDECLKNKS